MQLSSDFLNYLASYTNGDNSNQLPALSSLSKEMGLSVASLREQLEVAEALGLVEVRPRIGIRRLPYTFLPAVRQSLAYAIDLDPNFFDKFADLRNHIEASFWMPAVERLTTEDHAELKTLMAHAWEKLHGTPVQIPHSEHRQLHLLIYRRLDNVFVLGVLEAYWEAYEAVGLNLFTDYDYLTEVWSYHQQMVDAIVKGEYDVGYQALVEHKDLLYHRPFTAQSKLDAVQD